MNKLKKLSAMLLSLCFVSTTFTAMPVFAAPEVIVSDDFEQYQVDDIPKGWEISHNSRKDGLYGGVAVDPDDSSNKVLLLHTTDANSVNPLVKGQVNFKEIGGDVHIKFKIRIEELYDDCHYIGMIDNIARILTYHNQWNLWNGEEQRVLPNIGVEYNKWLSMEYIMSFTEKTYTIICDGVTWVENYGFQNKDMEKMTHLYFRNGRSSMYLDDIVITNDGAIKTMYTKIGSPKYKINATTQTIKDIDFETTVDEFMNNMVFVDGAVINIFNADGTPYTGRYITKNLQLEVCSPEGDQQKIYELQSKPWRASLLTIDYCKDAMIFADGFADAMIKGHNNYINANDSSVKTFKSEDTMYVPLRFIAEHKGHNVEWIASESAVKIGNLKLVQATSAVTKNGTPLNLTGKCINKDGTMFIPATWVGDMFGLQIREHGNFVVIKDNVSFTDPRAEKLVLNEISSRFIYGGE